MATKKVEKQIANGQWTVDFESVSDFYDYITTTPFNDVFQWRSHSSVENDYSFSQTHNYEEAVELMRNGWDDMAKKLTNKLAVIDKQTAAINKPRPIKSVAGYQAIVPRYLQGNPKSMVSKQMTPVKQKVVNVTKSINYNGGVKTDRMVEESIKALQIVKKLEAQGYRVNLYVSLGTSANNRKVFARVKIKSASERLNVSKLAFAMCHPSMLRRLYFRFVEVYPNITKGYAWGYGAPISADEMKKTYPDSIILPAFIDDDSVKASSLEELKSTTGC